MIRILRRPKPSRSHAAIVRVPLFMAFAALMVWSMSASGQDACSLVIKGKVDPAISIAISPSVVEWEHLRPGDNVLEDAVTVTMFSNVNYKATIVCESPHLNVPGGTDPILNMLEWKCRGGQFQPVCVVPAVVYQGGPSGDDGHLEFISFLQAVEYSDLPLSDPDASYEITVQFAIATSI